ncbi:MAG: cupin domain-containing protein [Alphaproteobacteria bacterium]|nr:cupin domain-containing protein [Alphaproteobacteria bacterium]
MTAEEIIDRLDLEPHPEGGHFREIYRAVASSGERSALTSIYYLLRSGERSAWHRVDASEVWHFHAGDPLELSLSLDGKTQSYRLGTGLLEGEQPQVVVPPHVWQSARPLGEWTLVGCTVGPGFEFDGFELAGPDFRPETG